MIENVRLSKRDIQNNTINEDGYNTNIDEISSSKLKTRRIGQFIDFNSPQALEKWISNISKKYSQNHNNNSDHSSSIDVEIRALVNFIEKNCAKKIQKINAENKFLSSLVKSQQETIRQLQESEKISNQYLQEVNALRAELNYLKKSIAIAFGNNEYNQDVEKSAFIHHPPPDIF